MKIFLAALLFIGLGVLGMCFNILFRKNGQFPQTDIGSNENMRKMGIKCMREVDEEIFSGKNEKRGNGICSGDYGESCIGCGLFQGEGKR